jgi:galactitol-specific phosphotransferase system IIB component
MNKMELKKQLQSMGIEVKDGKVRASAIKAALEKKVDLNILKDRIFKQYRDNPSKQPEIIEMFVDMANTLGIEIPYIDTRDMFLLADENGKFVKSFSGFKEAAKFVEENPNYKYYNRTHPKCPPELVKEFDEITGW